MTISSSKRATVGKKLKESSSKYERVHVIPQKGRWSVKAEHSEKALKILDSKQEAIKYVRTAITGELMRNVVVHGRGGVITSKISIGRRGKPKDTVSKTSRGRR